MKLNLLLMCIAATLASGLLADIPPDPLASGIEWAGATIPFGAIVRFVFVPVGLSVLLLRTIRTREGQRGSRRRDRCI